MMTLFFRGHTSISQLGAAKPQQHSLNLFASTWRPKETEWMHDPRLANIGGLCRCEMFLHETNSRFRRNRRFCLHHKNLAQTSMLHHPYTTKNHPSFSGCSTPPSISIYIYI